jgi:hypothetical protein
MSTAALDVSAHPVWKRSSFFRGKLMALFSCRKCAKRIFTFYKLSSAACLFFISLVILGAAMSTGAVAESASDPEGQRIIEADRALNRGDEAGALKAVGPIAEQGDARAQNVLGMIYMTLKDYKESYKWYKLAADQGDTFSQHIVGGDYDRG